MQRAVNYMRGSVQLEVEGPYPERFFNICSATGVRFWGVEVVDETTVRVVVARSQMRRAVELGPKCLCQVRTLREEGAPSLALHLRDRYGLLVGMALSLIAVLVFSRFILVIDIVGNTTLPDSVILSELDDIGLSVGSYGPGVDARAVSNRALMDLEELGFLTVNIRGIVAEIVVREAEPAPELEPTGVAMDLVAHKPGVILDVDGLAGQPVVEPGQEVSAGDVLISGTVSLFRKDAPEELIASYPTLAKGQVWAEVEEVFSASAPLSAWQKAYTGETATRYQVVLFGKAFKISSKTFQPFPYYDKIETSQALTLGQGLVLPLSLEKQVCAAYQPQALALDRDQVEEELRDVLSRRLESAMGEGGQVLNAAWSVTEENGALTVTVTARCREQIAVSATEENGTAGDPAPHNGDETI